MKAKILIAITFLELIAGQSHAVFFSTFPLHLITDFKVSVSKEDKQNASTGKVLKLFVNLVFGIVSEDGQSVTVDEKSLTDLGYTSEEIATFKNIDIPKLKKLSEKQQFQSMDDAMKAIKTLNQGVIAKEQVRLSIEQDSIN